MRTKNSVEQTSVLKNNVARLNFPRGVGRSRDVCACVMCTCARAYDRRTDYFLQFCPSFRASRSTMLLRGLSRTLTRQSAAFFLAKLARYWYETLIQGWSRGDKIHEQGTSLSRLPDKARTYSWKINYCHLHLAAGAKGSVMIFSRILSIEKSKRREISDTIYPCLFNNRSV